MDELDEDKARARQAAQVILDGVTASDPAADDGVVNDAMQLAFGRLLEIGAIELTAQEGEDDDEETELELDIAPLLGGVALVVGHLVDELARLGGVSREDVVASTRERLSR